MKFRSLHNAIRYLRRLSTSNVELNGVANIVQFNDLLKEYLEEGNIAQAKKMAAEIDAQAQITLQWLRELVQQGTELPLTYTDFLHMGK